MSWRYLDNIYIYIQLVSSLFFPSVRWILFNDAKRRYLLCYCACQSLPQRKDQPGTLMHGISWNTQAFSVNNSHADLTWTQWLRTWWAVNPTFASRSLLSSLSWGHQRPMVQIPSSTVLCCSAQISRCFWAILCGLRSWSERTAMSKQCSLFVGMRANKLRIRM